MIRFLTALAVLAVVALPGCGSDKKTIPSSDGASLIHLLRQARDQTGDPQKCAQLLTTVQRVQTRVASLPSSVDKNTKDSLVNGVNNLIDDARNECANTQTTTTTTPTTPTQTTPTQTVPTETTPTQTTPTQTTPTTPTQTTPTTPTPGNGGTPPGTGGTAPKPGKPGKPGKGEGKKGND